MTTISLDTDCCKSQAMVHHTVEQLSEYNSKYDTRYVLLAVHANNTTDIHYDPSMAGFVDNFLPRDSVTMYLHSLASYCPQQYCEVGNENDGDDDDDDDDEFNNNQYNIPGGVLPGYEEKKLSGYDYEEITEHYRQCFHLLQQLSCKTIAKAWIRAIEPKKQTNHPYNKGELKKPAWWPKEVRHKEPDHLMKPERLRLLMQIIRLPHIQIERLRRATRECSSYIQPGKHIILEELYFTAEMERWCIMHQVSTERSEFIISNLKKKHKTYSLERSPSEIHEFSVLYNHPTICARRQLEQQSAEPRFVLQTPPQDFRSSMPLQETPVKRIKQESNEMKWDSPTTLFRSTTMGPFEGLSFDLGVLNTAV